MQVLISDLDFVPGYTIKKHKGFVVGSTVRAKSFFQDIVAGFKNMFGGEVDTYTELIEEGRAEALKRLKKEAIECGANAVLSVRFSTSSVMLRASEILCYGTAVFVECEKKST